MERTVELKGGLVANADAIALGVRLEMAGHMLDVSNGKLVISRAQDLTPVVQAQVHALNDFLLALVTYRAPEASAEEGAKTTERAT